MKRTAKRIMKRIARGIKLTLVTLVSTLATRLLVIMATAAKRCPGIWTKFIRVTNLINFIHYRTHILWQIVTYVRSFEYMPARPHVPTSVHTYV